MHDVMKHTTPFEHWRLIAKPFSELALSILMFLLFFSFSFPLLAFGGVEWVQKEKDLSVSLAFMNQM